jgi:hypothetical protein
MKHAAQQRLVEVIDRSAIRHHHFGACLLVEQFLQVRIAYGGNPSCIRHPLDAHVRHDWISGSTSFANSRMLFSACSPVSPP